MALEVAHLTQQQLNDLVDRAVSKALKRQGVEEKMKAEHHEDDDAEWDHPGVASAAPSAAVADPTPCRAKNPKGAKNDEEEDEEYLPVFANPQAPPADPVALPKNCNTVQEWGAAIITAGTQYKGKQYIEAYHNKDYKKWLRANRGKIKAPVLRDLLKFMDAMDQEVSNGIEGVKGKGEAGQE